MTTHASSGHHHQVPPPGGVIIQQPIEIIADAKKEKTPPPGAFLYKDLYNSYRLIEALYLVSKPQSIVAFALGAMTGTAVASYRYYKFGPPKKISQDSESIDFGAKIHSSGFTEMSSFFLKRFALGTYPAANFDKLPQWTNMMHKRDVVETTKFIQRGFVAYKAAMLFDELVTRTANWLEVPAK